ncbi:LOW QUALITY PROTEIN: zinc finger FYVE domain-containing protein 9 [Hermetia illucens]|uniref:LOW QUALITY PROTEIN: zinc finger FYVE domain-containing protein 9 n=1 Tax=Hermetia illucens TaxID=343691 RepID=UPI0018CC4D80|nr:LOW QUALITY PROTEIN: zinc finger FYVE domain-containing protein 9 [Hermetia illucens]
MDLVDIDKVLDDLELNEDETKFKTPARHSVKTKVCPEETEQPQPQVQQAFEPFPVVSTIEANNNNEKPTKSKSFVNITNVFSCLHEYVNVDIEHIIRAGTPRKQEQELGDSHQETTQIPPQIQEKQPHGDNDDDEECTDCFPEDENCGGITSASSITTSSPSSFSSGPSPGSSSDSSKSFTPEDEFCNSKNDQEQDDDSPAKPEKIAERSDVDSHSSGAVTDPEGEIEPDINTYQGSRNTKGLDENSCELGLSSISSCFYNENTSSSFPGLSNDLYKLDALNSAPSSTPKDSEEIVSEEAEKSHTENIIDHHPTAINTPEQEVNFVQPDERLNPTNSPRESQAIDQPAVIGFGSTMDEISDTELDSILQEIDSDLQIFNSAKTSEFERETTQNEVLDTLDKSDVASASMCVPPVDRTSKATTDEDSHGNDNIANMDNFSQASTIEFAESRIQTDFENEPPAVQTGNYEGLATSDTLTTTECHQEICNFTCENQESNLDTDQTTKVNQHRPNSLDIPAQSINVISTAGQTPPASVLDNDRNTVSNSSSDDLSPQTSGQVSESEIMASTPIQATGFSGDSKLGKVPPFWIPDSEAPACMQCQIKFSLIKRRHHCRACGLVLCSTCCSQKAKLEFLGDIEVRVCVQCHLILRERTTGSNELGQVNMNINENAALNRSPNPNNPMEYCSVIPPHQQVTDAIASSNPISVMVPVGVLKREGVPPKNNRKDKNVIFSDGIRPGCDLAELDDTWDDKGESSSSSRKSGNNNSRKSHTPSGLSSPPYHGHASSSRSKRPATKFQESESYIPETPNGLPPIYTKNITETELIDVANDAELISRLKSETLQFAIQRNLYVFVKITKLKCCVNKTVMNFTSRGMHHVGQDEIVILLEYDETSTNPQNRLVPKDIFVHLNLIYCQAHRGRTVSELGFSMPNSQYFLGSRDHGGFLYIRPTFQCLLELCLPDAPFLIGILIHKWEIPWARVFPLRLMLRLGAQFRYYPSPHVSVPFRDPVYGEIAQTIINFLADFRNYSYTLGTIRGMYIHMEDRKTNVLIPKNRHDQILKALNNSSDHILALGGNLSKKADGHLVCIQNMESNCAESHTYSTQAINIQGQPRKVTGASFLVLNGALKSSSGLQGKCSIVEDGLMVQILPAKMALVRTALQNRTDVEIVCGPVDADESQTETVNILWTDDDKEFNIGVKSPIDGRKMDGIPSIRVHSGLNHSNASHILRWTEVFIIQMDDESPHDKDTIDVQKISEQIAKSASSALVSFLDLLAASGCVRIGLRVTLHQDNVCYETGSLNSKLPPLYMNALDNELIPTLHRLGTSLHGIGKPIIFELIFHILDK